MPQHIPESKNYNCSSIAFSLHESTTSTKPCYKTLNSVSTCLTLNSCEYPNLLSNSSIHFKYLHHKLCHFMEKLPSSSIPYHSAVPANQTSSIKQSLFNSYDFILQVWLLQVRSIFLSGNKSCFEPVNDQFLRFSVQNTGRIKDVMQFFSFFYCLG